MAASQSGDARKADEKVSFDSQPQMEPKRVCAGEVTHLSISSADRSLRDDKHPTFALRPEFVLYRALTSKVKRKFRLDWLVQRPESQCANLGEDSMVLDENKLQQFMGKMVGDLGAAMGATLVYVGDRLGLYNSNFTGR
jgi:hypothetical protein